MVNSAEHKEYQAANRCPFIQERDWTPGEMGFVQASHNGADPHEGAPHCPGACARQPIAAEALQGLRWRRDGQLQLLYPNSLPLVVVAAVDAAAEDLAEWEAEGHRVVRERAKVNRE